MYLTELVTLDRKITTEVAHPKEAKSEDNCSQKQIHDSDRTPHKHRYVTLKNWLPTKSPHKTLTI